MEELNKKYLNDPDNHNGVVIYLELDILEYEVKRVLGSITVNKTRGGVGILAKPFKILKDDAANKSATCSSGHRTGKGQFSFQSQRKAMPKNAQTTAQLCYLTR